MAYAPAREPSLTTPRTLGLKFERDPDGIDLDAAATTPPLVAVADAVNELVQTYGSVHRGSGWRSRVTSAAYEGARHAVRDFLGAREDDHVVFVRGTTEAANLLSACLPDGTVVISGAHEHHANLLPGARHGLRIVPICRSKEELLAAYEERLEGVAGRLTLLAVTGASNVSGEVFPIREIVALAKRHDALVFVDGAQLVPHRPIDMAGWGVDYLALSAHKMYAPYGAGALVGNRQLLDKAPPFQRGGGASANVTRDRVEWLTGPGRHEAGTPNVIGAVALGVACDVLGAVGIDQVASHERHLAERLFRRVDSVDGLERYKMWHDPGTDRLGHVVFNVAGQSPHECAGRLSSTRDIGVRAGRFCAHMLVDALVGTPGQGAVRASLGLHNAIADVDALVEALRARRDDRLAPRALPPRRLPFRLVWSS